MKFEIDVDVTNQAQADAVQRGLEKPDVLAFVVCVGLLEMLPSDRARKRCLAYVLDELEERSEGTRR